MILYSLFNYNHTLLNIKIAYCQRIDFQRAVDSVPNVVKANTPLTSQLHNNSLSWINRLNYLFCKSMWHKISRSRLMLEGDINWQSYVLDFIESELEFLRIHLSIRHHNIALEESLSTIRLAWKDLEKYWRASKMVSSFASLESLTPRCSKNIN